MRERKEPEFISFAQGEMVEGELVRIDTVEVGEQKKRTARFTVRDIETNELASFLGTYDLVTKLRPEDRGHYVRIRFEGEDKSVTRNGNAMKKFKVEVSAEPVAKVPAGGKHEDGSPNITDADVPF
jgi:hypothetical protein